VVASLKQVPHASLPPVVLPPVVLPPVVALPVVVPPVVVPPEVPPEVGAPLVPPCMVRHQADASDCAPLQSSQLAQSKLLLSLAR
jgi:hypothetical protein